MYLKFYGLTEKPFSQTPDPKFLYFNEMNRETIASLRYGIQERKGFITLIGEAGTGKTTLLRKLLDDLGPEVVSVFLFNPNASFDEILEYTLSELGISAPAGRKLAMLQRLNDFLLAGFAEGRNTILMIDEAQDLEPDVLESLRLLSNLESSKEKILQIVLSGQPELAIKLAQPNLRQLKQRIAVRCRLEPLGRAELTLYIKARLAVAGGNERLFAAETLDPIWEFATGIPRLINTVCDSALLVGYALEKKTIDREVIDEVLTDLRKLDVRPEELMLRQRQSAGPAPKAADPSGAGVSSVAATEPPTVVAPPFDSQPSVVASAPPSMVASPMTIPPEAHGLPSTDDDDDSPVEPISTLSAAAVADTDRASAAPGRGRGRAARPLRRAIAALVILGLIGTVTYVARSSIRPAVVEQAPLKPAAPGDAVPVTNPPPPTDLASTRAEPAPQAADESAPAVARLDPEEETAASNPSESGAAQISPRPSAADVSAPAKPDVPTKPDVVAKPDVPTKPDVVAKPDTAVPGSRSKAKTDVSQAATHEAFDGAKDEARADIETLGNEPHVDKRPAARVQDLQLSQPQVRGHGKRVLVRRGDTLLNLAAREYGSANFTTLDVVKAANPAVRDVNKIVAGTELTFPDPGPAARIMSRGKGLSVIVMTTPSQPRALAMQRELQARYGSPVAIESIGLSDGHTLYRLSMGEYRENAQALKVAESLGNILSDRGF